MSDFTGLYEFNSGLTMKRLVGWLAYIAAHFGWLGFRILPSSSSSSFIDSPYCPFQDALPYDNCVYRHLAFVYVLYQIISTEIQ